MAVIGRDGTVAHNPRLLGSDGGSMADEMLASLDELTQLFGRDDHVDEAPPGWAIRVENPGDEAAAVVSLYCYRDIRPRAYRHTEFMFSLAVQRGQRWAVARVREVIEAARKTEGSW